MNTKELILAVVSDCVIDLLYYDRKEDEDLKVDDIDNFIRAGGITIDEIIQCFSDELNKGLS